MVIKELPVLGPESHEAAKYALAVFYHDKSRYEAVSRRLMAKPGRHYAASIKAALKAEGIYVETLEVSDKVGKQITENMKLAAELGIRGTPALVFPDKVLRGYTQEADLQAMIKSLL